MTRYNPLAEFICHLLDRYIDRYVESCKQSHHPISLDDFKDVLNNAYKYEGMSDNLARTLESRFIQRNIAL